MNLQHDQGKKSQNKGSKTLRLNGKFIGYQHPSILSLLASSFSFHKN
jgi:hypothetical protein